MISRALDARRLWPADAAARRTRGRSGTELSNGGGTGTGETLAARRCVGSGTYDVIVTRQAAERLAKLIAQADGLDDLANQVQEDRTVDPEGKLRQLQADYGNWYAEALSVLAADLQGPFKAEYEGGTFSVKIKDFLQGGLELNVMFADLVAKGMTKWLRPFGSAFHGPLLAQRQILRNAAAAATGRHGLQDHFDRLEETFRRLPQALAVLRQELRDRGRIDVTDEYDLQRIVHAILCLHSRDIRLEEYGPSSAGSRPRLDFLLKEERIAVETKMTRAGLGPKKLGDELAADVLRYQQHPHVDGYFALVYDPKSFVINSHGFEKDFPTDSAFPTRVVIVH